MLCELKDSCASPFAEPIFIYKKYKTEGPKHGGHTGACAVAHLAVRDKRLYKHASQPSNPLERHNVWVIEQPPRHTLDMSNQVLDQAAQSPQILIRLFTLLGSKTFMKPRLTVFSSGDACGWVARVAISNGDRCYSNRKRSPAV